MTASTSGVIKETRRIAGTGRTYSNKRNRENKYNSGQKHPAGIRRTKWRNEKRSLCNGDG